MEKITTDTLVSTTEFAAVIGKTARRVNQLVQDGVILRDKKGIPLADGVQRYIDHLTKDFVKGQSDIEIDRTRKEAEASLKVSKAKVAELEADELEGKMHRAEDIEVLTNDFIFTIRSALIAFPGRVAVDVYNAESPAEASEVIKKELYKVMRELANYEYDPKKYKDRVRERREWTEEEDE